MADCSEITLSITSSAIWPVSEPYAINASLSMRSFALSSVVKSSSAISSSIGLTVHSKYSSLLSSDILLHY